MEQVASPMKPSSTGDPRLFRRCEVDRLSRRVFLWSIWFPLVLAGCQNMSDWMRPASQPARPPAQTAAPAAQSAPEPTVAPIPPEQAAALTPVGRRPPRPLGAPVRAIWVARFHYRYEDDVRIILRNCAQLGMTTVLWQVRGEGTVQYPSTFEPWSEEFRYKDPGFDPLAVAVQEAQRLGLRIEPWINIMPGWKGPKPPWIRDQLWWLHRDWFLADERGERAPLGDFYALLNPALPEVRRHLVGIVSEIAARYDVDGIHLDYIRYAWDTEPRARERYPRDPRTLELYRRESGLGPDDNPAAWDDWRANQLTRLVTEIRRELNRVRPGATLTAAVRSDPYQARRDFLQNPVTWLKNQLVDAVYPMAYTERLEDFQRDIESYRRLAPGSRIIPGIGIYKHNRPEPMLRQLAHCRAQGGDFGLYSYDSLFPTARDREGVVKPVERGQRDMRRQTLEQFASGR
jgi:uncharacterized lipoprotein YddW (UPF0748 family)